jgi:hypothetical protein
MVGAGLFFFVVLAGMQFNIIFYPGYCCLRLPPSIVPVSVRVFQYIDSPLSSNNRSTEW